MFRVAAEMINRDFCSFDPTAGWHSVVKTCGLYSLDPHSELCDPAPEMERLKKGRDNMSARLSLYKTSEYESPGLLNCHF